MTRFVVRTVTGDIDPGDLGRVDYHEHLLMRSPLLRGDALDDLERSAAETASLRGAGIDALCELTPIGVGRDPRGVSEIARRTGMRVVLATGIHQQAHYPPEHWAHRIDESDLAELFVTDLLDGCDGNDYSGPRPDPTTVRAGVIKVGAGYWSISDFERKVIAAAGEAHQRTGAAVIAHLERGTAGLEVLAELERAGVPPGRVGLAHCDRNPDPSLHVDLIAAGATVGYDGMARAKYWPDRVILDCLAETIERAPEPRIVLGGDVARRRSFAAHGGLPGMAYLPARFVPRVVERLGDELCERLLVDNPARLLCIGDPSR